ncbi:MAG TPA: ABC transporter permease [Thermoanaerobaculia bacterium]|nr:ABC transporter permease [Thermoanaerobaculia bacterium]
MNGAALERIGEIVRKELRQIFRDPRMRAVIFVAPLIQLVVFGYAVSTDVRNTPMLVVDHDRTAASRSLVEAMTSSGWFRLAGRSHDERDMVSGLDHGEVVVGLVIPAGLARELERGTASVQVIFDGTNSNVATVARGYAERILIEWGLRHAGTPRPPAIELRERAWFNPALDSRSYNVPGVAGLIIFLICLLLTSLAIVREREVGTLEQLMVSPIRPWELIAGKCIPFAAIGLFDLALVTAVAMAWFDVPFRGSASLLLLASALYIVSGLGIGLFISTISSTQQEAFMATFLVFLPAILLAGFMFPVRSMPELFQAITIVNPVRHYLEIVRSIFLKGAGFAALWQHFVALLLIGGSILAVAAARFEKRIG